MSAADSSNILNRLELSYNLRGSLQRAAGYAYQQSHREVTLEHLLLALAEDRDAAVILEASNVDISGLVTEVSDYLGRLDDRVVGEEARQPTLGRDLIHICQSAAAAAQKSQRRAIGSALVLAAIVGCNLSFATPMGYQTNVLIMQPGGYVFRDFVRVGGPLVLLMIAAFSFELTRAYPI